jgi:signal transduction histidine kinase/ActR/RegA family two-component response regulator
MATAAQRGWTAGRTQLPLWRLLESLPAAAYTCDAAGLITYYNARAVELWGRAPKLNDPADRFCGSFKLVTADGKPIPHDQCWMALALREGREYNGEEILIERPNGDRLTVLANANPIYDASGALSGAVNVLTDVSRLRQADLAKDEFLAVLGHELRNPLAALRHAVELLRDPVFPNRRWAVDVVDRQTEHLARLVEDLLEGSRVSARKLELRKQRVELAEIARLAVETSGPLIEAAGHELAVTLPTGSIVVDGDSARLVQALVNLLNNAAKYTPPGGRVWLLVEALGDVAAVTVRDSGSGIAADMLDRVFEMFTRADRSLERDQGGLGIGLAVAKRIIEMHGGTIHARSDGAGKGAEFVVRLPIADGRSVGAAPARNDFEVADRVTPRRILVVDDNRDATDALTILLKTQGHLVRTAYDGIEAVEAAKAHRPEVVLLDLGLPRLNGYEVARAIRALPWGQQAELIAVTGYGQAEDRRLAAQAGFDRHLVKPVQAAQLKAILASIDHRSDG